VAWVIGYPKSLRVFLYISHHLPLSHSGSPWFMGFLEVNVMLILTSGGKNTFLRLAILQYHRNAGQA
jgi:hypothetical protein